MNDNPFKDSSPLPSIDTTLSMVIDAYMASDGVFLNLQSPGKDIDGNSVPVQRYSYTVTSSAKITTDMHRGLLSPSELLAWIKDTANDKVGIDVRLTWDMDDPLQIVNTAHFVHYGT